MIPVTEQIIQEENFYLDSFVKMEVETKRKFGTVSISFLLAVNENLNSPTLILFNYGRASSFHEHIQKGTWDLNSQVYEISNFLNLYFRVMLSDFLVLLTYYWLDCHV